MGKTVGFFRCASDTPKPVRDFARDNVFTHRNAVPEADFEAPVLSLELVLERLHDCGINAGLQSFAFTGLTAWIGDQLSGKKAEAELSADSLAWRRAGSLSQWMHRTAVQLFRDSDYARNVGAGPGSGSAASRRDSDAAPSVVEVPAWKPFDTVPFPENEQRISASTGPRHVASLETVLKDLLDSEINAGAQTSHPAGLRIWIGDQLNGLSVSARISPNDAGWLADGTVALWLHETALKEMPASEYAGHFTPCGQD
jgi:hypothetical protein